jgi:hypothetical protein
MSQGSVDKQQLYRLWIAKYSDWRPTRWNQSPPQAVALELARDAPASAEEAAHFLEGFNNVRLESQEPVWAIAIPVTVRYEGDARPGLSISAPAFFAEQPTGNLTALAGGIDDVTLPGDLLGAE